MPLIKVYMSSATSDLGVKKRQQSLKFLLEKKKINVEEIDLAAIDKTVRDDVYNKAGTRNLPLVFKDDQFIGTYDDLQYAEEDERLDQLLA